MLEWVDYIDRLTVDNSNFRTVVNTGEHHTQLIVMSLIPGEEIGWESHDDRDQYLRLEQGRARVDSGSSEDGVDESHEMEDDWAFIE